MLPDRRPSSDNANSISIQARSMFRWMVEHYGVLIVAGLALAAFIIIFLPGLTAWIKANLIFAVMLGLIVGLGAGTGLLYYLKGNSAR